MSEKKKGFRKTFLFKKKILRSLFLHIEKDKEKGTASELESDLLERGMSYIQMKLPVDKITTEFENSIKEKIEHNIYHAHIREATEKDLQSIVNIYNKAWLTGNTPFHRLSVETIQKIYNDPYTVFLIATIYGIDGAFAILDFEGENKEYGIIAGLGVLPRFQRKGLGTVLGLAAWDYFKNKGVKELRCEVYKGNQKSFNFIKGLKFKAYGEKSYHREDFELE